MNRSYRGKESLMPSIRQNFPQLRSSVRDKEDDLRFFLELRKRDKDKNELLLLNDADELNDSLVSQPGSSPLFNIPTTRKTGPDDFLSSDCEKNDYDWLLTPPGTPLFPSLDIESMKTYVDEAEAPKARPSVLRSSLANSQLETTARSNSLSRPTASTGPSSSVSGIRRSSSSSCQESRIPSCGPGSRSVTPTGRPSLNSSKSSRSSTPTSRATLLPSAKLTGSSSTRSTSSMASARSSGPSRSSTPTRSTARPIAPSVGPSRSSTPSKSTSKSSMPAKPTARSSTPPAKPIGPTPRPTSRTSTPTRRPSVPSTLPSASLNKSLSSLSSKSGSAPSKNPVPSRGPSPTVKSRSSWNPTEMPGFSLDAPPNLRTTLPSRPISATRGRPAAPSARSASLEPVINGRRRQSCSPSRGRSPNLHASGGSVPAVSRGHSKVNDDVSPVVIGTRMVERVVHMRKLVPPRQDDKQSPGLSGKSASSPDSSGFGRTLSKKSLDMAMRHMDIRRSIPGNLRPLMTKIPASSLYSVRSGPNGNGTTSISDSPIATNSNESSEHSVNNHVVALDRHGSEMEDDL